MRPLVIPPVYRLWRTLWWLTHLTRHTVTHLFDHHNHVRREFRSSALHCLCFRAPITRTRISSVTFSEVPTQNFPPRMVCHHRLLLQGCRFDVGASVFQSSRIKSKRKKCVENHQQSLQSKNLLARILRTTTTNNKVRNGSSAPEERNPWTRMVVLSGSGSEDLLSRRTSASFLQSKVRRHIIESIAWSISHLG